jgi:hypothetical protein
MSHTVAIAIYDILRLKPFIAISITMLIGAISKVMGANNIMVIACHIHF